MPLTKKQKLNFIQVILERCTEEELEPVLVEVAVEFLKDLQDTKE
jgi:hypothetical protein